MRYDRRVLIDLDGRCVCPYHGAQAEGQEFASGRAACGCVWQMAGDGVTLLAANLVANIELPASQQIAAGCEPTAENAT